MCFAAHLETDLEKRTPKTLRKALTGEDRDLWMDAIGAEFDSLEHHEVFQWAIPPPHQRALNHGFVFRIKPAQDGKPEKYKARLVVRGNEAVAGIDYNAASLYAPIVSYKSLRFTCALAAQLGLELHKMDIKTAFLNGDLEETVFMEPPLGFARPPGKENHKWELKKSLYGLKQAPRQWNIKLNIYLLESLGFRRLNSDWGIYFKHNEDGTIIIIDVYVDDLFIASKPGASLTALKKDFSTRFDLVDYGICSSILNIALTQSPGSVTLDQQTYIDEIVDKFGQSSSKGRVSPLNPGVPLSLTQAPQDLEGKLAMQSTPYREAVGSLMHLMVCTGPDIAYAVGVVSRYSSNP